MSDEFEKALRRALRHETPGEDFADRIAARLDPTAAAARDSTAESPAAARLDSTDASPTAADLDATAPPPAAIRLGSMRRRVFRSRWLPAALAACVVAGFGLAQLRQHALDTARANQARAQLLQALSIASDNINIVRTTIAREEDPNS